MAEPSDTDWAYAAGFVDGEGCIAIVRSFVPNRGRYYYQVHVVVSNGNREVLGWMQGIWGGWVVGVTGRDSKYRAAWHWRVATTLAKPFLSGIRPWLRVKAPQCDNALGMIVLLRRSRRTLGPYPMPPEWIAEQEHLYWIQRELNHRGSADFVKKPMHSPRRIKRERALWAQKGALSTASSLEPEPVDLPPLASYEAGIEQALARDLAFGDNLVVYEYHGDTEVIEPV